MTRLHERLAIPTLAICMAAAACDGGQPNAAPPATAAQTGAAAAPAPAAPASTPSAVPTGTSGPAAAAAVPASAPAPRAAKRTTPVPVEATPTSTPVPERAALAAAPVLPPPPPEPRFRDITIPEGTTLTVKLTTPPASEQNKVEDPLSPTLSSPLGVDGFTLLPGGAEVNGTVLDVKSSGRVKGLASITFRFDRVHAHNVTHTIDTDRITQEANSTKGKDATKVGIGAGAGALIGGIAGGGKGAAIGSLIGGGAATGAVAATKGEEVRLPPGTPVTVTLRAPLVVRVRID